MSATDPALLEGLPGWLHPGQPVLWVQDDTHTTTSGVRFIRPATVERVTKTLIVLDNGEKFRRTGIRHDVAEVTRRLGDGSHRWSRSSDHLWQPGDERVEPLRRAIRERKAWHEALSKAQGLSRSGDLATVVEARDALNALIETLGGRP